LLLAPIGLAYFGLYYGLFRFFIVRFNLMTPGREIDEVANRSEAATQDDSAQGWIRALGGAGNLVAIDACTTRLRLSIADQKAVDEPALKSLGARGLVRPSPTTLQVVVGPIADQLASSIRAGLKIPASVATAAVVSNQPTPSPSDVKSNISTNSLLQALGGIGNIRELRLAASRLCITLNDASKVGEPEKVSGVRGIAHPAPNSFHVIAGPAAQALFAELDRLRASGAPIAR